LHRAQQTFGSSSQRPIDRGGSAVFTIGCVANLLGEDEERLHDLSIDMFPEDGCLWVYGVGEDGVPAFTQDGIENLRQIIADERADGPRAADQAAQIATPAVLTAC
jgi:hypothetical protein